MEAPPRPDYPIITPDKLGEYGAFLMSVPARYGTMGTQWRVSLSDCNPRKSTDSLHRSLVTGILGLDWPNLGNGQARTQYAGVLVSTGGKRRPSSEASPFSCTTALFTSHLAIAMGGVSFTMGDRELTQGLTRSRRTTPGRRLARWSRWSSPAI
jgi:hypothetical protein